MGTGGLVFVGVVRSRRELRKRVAEGFRGRAWRGLEAMMNRGGAENAEEDAEMTIAPPRW